MSGLSTTFYQSDRRPAFEIQFGAFILLDLYGQLQAQDIENPSPYELEF